MRRILIGILALFFLTGKKPPESVHNIMTDSLANRYPFLKLQENHLLNWHDGLNHFYEQLCLLEEGEINRVKIVHVGDSHLQADWFSGTVRMLLHQRFGSAGRGLIFPYQLARTNSPPDIRAKSNTKWEIRKNISRSGSLPIGISGITARTAAPGFTLKIAIQNNPFDLDYRFNKVTLFTDKGPRNFDLSLSRSPEMVPQELPTQNTAEPEPQKHLVQPGENLLSISKKFQVPVESLQELNQLEGTTIYSGQNLIVRPAKTVISPATSPTEPLYEDFASIRLSTYGVEPFASTVYLPEVVEEVYVRSHQTQNQQNQTTLYGMVLENYDQPGLLYHMIGVNGAQFHHYVKSSYFFEQMQSLAPDLVIISLGANEANNTAFRQETFFDQVDAFIHELEKYMPFTNVLITTPSDAYRYGRSLNKDVSNAREVLLQYSLGNGHASWDFYDVMGSEGSIVEWQKEGLAQKDKLHLTQAGYELQARLMYEALQEGYDTYLNRR